MSKSRQQRFRNLAKAPFLFAALALAGPTLASSPLAAAPTAQPTAQGDGQTDDLERLQRMLQEPGPDGREAREQAVAQLLAMARPAAHRLLQERLLQKQDPDGLRATILTGLQRHLLNPVSSQFGSADAEVRKQILIGYLGACAPLWADGADQAADIQQLACTTLQRVPARELDAAARALMAATGDPASHVHVLYCLSDLQQTLLARTIADQLEAPDEAVRDAAREALHRLTYAQPKITTKAEFEAWHATFGSWRYVDLAQRAARRGPQPLEELRRQLVRQRVDAAREFVTAHVERTPGVDWAIVQDRTISDEPAVLDACLETLQALLSRTPVGEGNAMQRQSFCRALLDRFKQVPADMRPELQNRRALLLEVAAHLARPQEVELANEIRTQLLAQLKSGPRALQIAALRGLRRYPSPEARATLVAYARRLLPTVDQNRDELQAILETLASRTAPRWPAPTDGAEDKADWLQLVTDCCRIEELRTSALKLAQTLDRDEARVPEAFGILLALVRDPTPDTKFRSTAMLYLEAWRSDDGLANEWIAALHALLEDDAAVLRKQAADSLARLGESVDPRRGEWFQQSMAVLRERLFAEPDSAVLNALVECVRKIGKQPQMPELAIGTLKYVLGRIEKPVPAEHQFRMDPLLQVLAEIAADQKAETDQWQAACEPLLTHGKRASVRLVLKAHAAIDLTKGVSSGNEAEAERARRAMRLIIEAATLKPERTSWASTEELRREARDVRTAFIALDAVDAAHRLDDRRHRLLRLSVDLVAGKWNEVVQRASEWLQGAGGNGGNGEATPRADDSYLDRLRLLAAEAQLALSKPKEAEALLAARSANGAADPEALDLSSRVARALAASDPRSATALFERTLRATATEDPAFRVRLVDWMKCRLKHDPDSRSETLREAEQHSGLFQADDCPAELRQEFEQLLKAE